MKLTYSFSSVSSSIGGVHLVVQLVQIHSNIFNLQLGVLEHSLGVLAQFFVLLYQALTKRLQHILGANLDLHLDLKLTVQRLQSLFVRRQTRWFALNRRAVVGAVHCAVGAVA
jgi:hypothetical protein